MPEDRSLLHRQIAQRMETMLQAGLVEELRELQRRFNLDANRPSMRCVGYRQAWEHLEGRLAAGELLDRCIYATRQLAKRQMTWIRAMQGVNVMDCADPELMDKAVGLITTLSRTKENGG